MLHDPCFEPHQVYRKNEGPFEPVAASTSVNWDLISRIDPDLLGHPSVQRNFDLFLSELPFYKFSSADGKILGHTLAIRIVLLMQRALVLTTQKLHKLVNSNKRQLTQIHKLAEQVKAQDEAKNVKNLSICEKCYVCSKRFRSMKQLNAHMAKDHPSLVTSWNKIISNDYLDENLETIAKLKAKIYQLRVQLHDQDAYRTQEEQKLQRIRELARKQQEYQDTVRTSAMAVQPRHGPLPQIQTADLRFDPMFGTTVYDASEEEDDEEHLDTIIHDACGLVREQAKIATGRKDRKKFQRIRESLRIHLEKQIPIPEEVPPQGRRTAQSRSSKRSASESYADENSMTSVSGPLRSPQQKMPRIVEAIESTADSGYSSSPVRQGRAHSHASVESVSSGSESDSEKDNFLITDSDYITD